MTDMHLYGIRGTPPFYAELYPIIGIISRKKLSDWWIFKYYKAGFGGFAKRGNPGMVVTKIYYPDNPRTDFQQAWREVHHQATYTWHYFEQETKRYYNSRTSPKAWGGYWRYLSLYLRDNYPLTAYEWSDSRTEWSDTNISWVGF